MAKLIVQIDPVATLREAGRVSRSRPGRRRHSGGIGRCRRYRRPFARRPASIQDRDLRVLRKVVHTRFDFKMTPTSEMLGVALNIKPDMVILLSEMREESSLEGGLDLMVHGSSAAEMVDNLDNSGIPVGVFIEPDPEQLKLAHQCSANSVEINTGTYCEATTSAKRNQVFIRIVDTVKLAHRLKIGVHVGDGVGFNTIAAFEGLKEIDTFTIGHSIIASAVLVGMQEAVRVRDMRRHIKEL